MRRVFFVALAVSFAIFAAAHNAWSQQFEDRLINVPGNDADMKTAIREARGTLSEFWKTMAKPGPGEDGFSLRVAIKDGARTEHLWVVNIERKSGKLAGTISNNPEWVKSVTYSQRYEFKEDSITDWTFRRHGKFVGNRTGRVLMKQMTKEDAERFRQMFEKP